MARETPDSVRHRAPRGRLPAIVLVALIACFAFGWFIAWSVGKHPPAPPLPPMIERAR